MDAPTPLSVNSPSSLEPQPDPPLLAYASNPSTIIEVGSSPPLVTPQCHILLRQPTTRLTVAHLLLPMSPCSPWHYKGNHASQLPAHHHQRTPTRHHQPYPPHRCKRFPPNGSVRQVPRMWRRQKCMASLLRCLRSHLGRKRSNHMTSMAHGNSGLPSHGLGSVTLLPRI